MAAGARGPTRGATHLVNQRPTAAGARGDLVIVTTGGGVRVTGGRTIASKRGDRRQRNAVITSTAALSEQRDPVAPRCDVRSRRGGGVRQLAAGAGGDEGERGRESGERKRDGAISAAKAGG